MPMEQDKGIPIGIHITPSYPSFFGPPTTLSPSVSLKCLRICFVARIFLLAHNVVDDELPGIKVLYQTINHTTKHTIHTFTKCCGSGPIFSDPDPTLICLFEF